MEALQRAKGQSEEVVAAYIKSVLDVCSHVMPGRPPTIEQVKFAMQWYATVMFRPDTLARVLVDPLFKSSPGYLSRCEVPEAPAAEERTTFGQALRELLNRYCVENQSQTPDFILASFMAASLDAFNRSVEERDQWYGYRELTPKPEAATLEAE
jgi:hypothetical protein